MNRSLVSSVLLAALCAMGTAHAGTVYVPLPSQTTAGTTTYEVQVSVANTSAAPATVNEALLPSDADGTQRTGVTTGSLAVNGGQASVVKPGTFSGLLELAGAADFRYSARLVNVAGGLGVDLPLITSSTVTKANGRLSLQGLITDAARTVDVALVNLATTASQCTVSFSRATGAPLGAVATVSLNPLSHRYFTNVLSGLVDASGVSDARAQVSCTQDFYSYGVLKNGATGELALVQPAASGDSALGSGGPPPPTGGGCGSAGVTCFDAKGIVHQPSPVNPVGRVTFAIPQGTYRRFKMSMDVTVGPWYAPDPAGKALIYWFVIDKNLDMPGLLYFRGPGSGGYTALARHGMGLTHPQKLKIVKPFQAQIGHTYHIDNDYDMGGHSYVITITDKASGEVTVLNGAPNVSLYTTKAGQHFIIDMGFHENAVPDEVPSYNWLYQNIHIEAYN
jgi:hypothetical protein